MESENKVIDQEPETRRMADDPTNRRVHPRFEIPLWKYIKFRFEGIEHIGYVKNVSHGGLFVESKVLLDKDIRVEFEFYLPDSNLKVFGMAQIAWVRKDLGNSLKPPGMGFQFIEFGGESEKILADFIGHQI